MKKPTATRTLAAWAYWSLVAVLVGFGLLAIFDVGLPFLLTGLTLAVLAPVRHRPRSFWPWLVALWAFFIGYPLVAPLGCTRTSGIGLPDRTICSSLLGHYAGRGAYDPPLWPALAVASIFAVAGWALARRLLAIRPR